MEKEKVLFHLDDIRKADKSDLDLAYNDMMGLIETEAIEKNIQFDGFFREKYKKMTNADFDEDYFKDCDRMYLYVFLAALKDPEIFDYVAYVFDHIRKEKLTENIVHREILHLEEKGVKF